MNMEKPVALDQEKISEKEWAEVFVDACSRLLERGVPTLSPEEQKKAIRGFLTRDMRQSSEGLGLLEQAARMQLYGTSDTNTQLDTGRQTVLSSSRAFAELVFQTLNETRLDLMSEEAAQREAIGQIPAEAEKSAKKLYETVRSLEAFEQMSREQLEAEARALLTPMSLSKHELEELYIANGTELNRRMPPLENPSDLEGDTYERAAAFLQKMHSEGKDADQMREESNRTYKELSLILAIGTVTREMMDSVKAN